MDAIVVLFSVVALSVPQLQVLRSLRAIRPLRVIIRSQQVRVCATH